MTKGTFTGPRVRVPARAPRTTGQGGRPSRRAASALLGLSPHGSAGASVAEHPGVPREAGYLITGRGFQVLKA